LKLLVKNKKLSNKNNFQTKINFDQLAENMTEFDYKKLKKGIGVRVKIPDDVHNDNKQNIRPGIFIKFEKNYAVIQLCTSQSSNFDFATFFANNKRQYLRSIYTKNVPFNQIKDL